MPNPATITQGASQNAETEALYFPVTADSALTGTLKDTVLRSCGGLVSSLKIEPLPHKHQSRLWIHIKAPAFAVVMHAIISDIPEAELGPVMHIRALPMEKSYAA